MRKLAILVSLATLCLVAVFAMPAGAAPTGAFVFNGTAHLNSGFPCTAACSGTFDGTARGTATPGVNCTAGCAMTASFSYNEPFGQCTGGVPVAPTGTANGTYSIGTLSGGFSWTRVGVTAVLVLSSPTGVAVAGFVPPLGCAPTNATVAGVAVTI